MAINKIIKLYEEEEFYATCPECGGTEWLLPVNGIGVDWNKIKGTICADPDCNCFIQWIVAVKGMDEINLESKVEE